jgi:NDP-sugar pyrophosphorylase family protein
MRWIRQPNTLTDADRDSPAPRANSGKVVILAAGVGSRLGPLTRALPKPMMPIANRPILERILGQLVSTGYRDVFINLHHHPTVIEQYFEDDHYFDVSIVWNLEERLTGPAGALLGFPRLRDESQSILVVSGDCLHNFDLENMVGFHHQRDALLTVAVREITDAGRFGVAAVSDDDRITAFMEKPRISPEDAAVVSCGVYCLSSSCLDLIPADIVYDFGTHLIPRLAESGAAVYAYRSDAYWSDIGTPHDLWRANLDAVMGRVQLELYGQMIGDGIYVEPGATIGRRCRLSGPILIGRGAKVHSDVEVIGPVVIGSMAEIGAGSVVMHSLVMDHGKVATRSTVINAIVAGNPPPAAGSLSGRRR